MAEKPSILKVAQMGHPTLRQTTEPLKPEEIADPATGRLIDSMIATMRDHNGVGLAAPQVHSSKRIVVVGVNSNSRDPDDGEIPLTILINPEITSFSDLLEEGWEGCLSLKNIWGRVKRSNAITVESLNREGKAVKIEAEGFLAIALQHEIDHLFGKLFIDRMEDLSTLCFGPEQKYLMEEQSEP